MILLRIFKNNRLLGTVAIFLLVLALYIPSFVEVFSRNGPAAFMPYTCMPFYQLIFGAIHKVPALNLLVAMVITLTIAWGLIQIGVRDQLLEQRSFMPAFFLILFTAALPEARQVSPALVSSLFYILAFAILFEVHDKKADTYSIFTASLILVLGSMFCLRLIWFVPLLWISILTMRSMSWREFMYPLVAYAILALFLFTWYWGIQSDGVAFAALISENLAIRGAFEASHYSVYLLYGYFLLLVLIASVHMIDRFQSRKTVVQNIFQVLFYMFLAGLLFFVFVLRFEYTGLVYIALPVTYVLSNFFHRRRNPWYHEVVLWILVGLVVYVQVMA